MVRRPLPPLTSSNTQEGAFSRRVRYLALALLASAALGASACADATAPDVCADSGYNGSGTLDSGYNGSGTFCSSSGYNGSGTSGYNGSGTSGYNGSGTSGYNGSGT
jgi:hypothetical protein